MKSPVPKASKFFSYPSRRLDRNTETRMKYSFFFPALIGLAMLISAIQTHAASPSGLDTNVQTRIAANKLTYQAEKRLVVFEGNVHVNRPDFDLRSNRLTVYLKPAQADKKSASAAVPGLEAGDVDRLVAQGSVIMTEPGGRSGTSDKATYTTGDGVLVMEGNPRLTDGENTITGETIRYYTQQNRSEVIGGSKKRVEAVFTNTRKGKI